MGLDDDQQRVLANLKKKRAVIKASLTRVRTFVSKFDPLEQAVSLLEFRQEELPLINRKYDDIQSEIELLAVDDFTDAEIDREQFETDYFAIRSQMQELINSAKTTNTTVHNTSYGSTASSNRTQLAPIPLPNFNGDIQEWNSFFDIFQAMVHHDDTYSPAQKFFYLRSCLQGTALELVRSIPVCDANYVTIVQRLKQRYDNRSLVIQSHIRSILECPRADDSSQMTLQRLYACVSTHVAALKALNQPVEHWDAWLVTIIVSRLDRSTAHGWQLHLKNTELPTYSDLEAFLASRCTALESLAQAGGAENDACTTGARGQKSASSKKILLVTDRSEELCVCCPSRHKLYACETFKKMSQKDRFSKVREAHRCFNCLSPYHSANNCKSKNSCQKCNKKHNTLLHFEKEEMVSGYQNTDRQETPMEPANSTALCASQVSSHVYLATAEVLVADRHGMKRQCCAVLDSGSQLNFISKKMATLLNLPRSQSNVNISGIGASQVRSVSSVSIEIASRVKPFSIVILCHVLPTIIETFPAFPSNIGDWNIPNELVQQLADPSFKLPRTIDMLIGGGAFFELLEAERVQIGVGSLCLQDTKLGWVVAGELSSTCLLSMNSIGQELEEGWTMLENSKDYGGSSKANRKCMEEQKARKHFEDTVQRDRNGRFLLRLPLKPEVNTIGVVESSRDLICRYSDWRRLVRATAWLAKFIKYVSSKVPEQLSRHLLVSDLKQAEEIILRRVQVEVFRDEIDALEKGLEIPRKSKLVALRPILKDGLLRVGGRLQNAELSEMQRHPVVIPAKHKVTRLIFQEHHRLMLHCGPQSLLASVRQRFWPLKGRGMARTVVVKCIGCVRAKPRFESPLMAPMPKLRVTAARPFTSTGVDFAGPLIIRSGMRRSPGRKAWIAVFVCFATRAIHLEAVEDLTSSAFIASLRRFMARRGKCSDIFSDNGTNFVGAKKELAAYLKNVDQIASQDGVSWHFNPPSAPHFGGLWESAVKAAKYHLTRVVKDAKLTLSEITTLLCQIEACLNSRPMTPISSDPGDMEALTPAHFLIGGPMFLHAEPDLTKEKLTSLKRWKYVQYLMQTFWLRWRNEYLPQLQVRGKWLTQKKNLALNDVVIIKEECAPPTKWRLGRVKELHPGNDGIVRVVTLQTANNKELRRPVVKLCRLPVDGDEEEVENDKVEPFGLQRGEDVSAKYKTVA